MSDVARLEAELALAKQAEALEAAREAMHADRSEETIGAYKTASAEYAAARTAFREAYPPPPPAEGDAVATPETVTITSKVERP
jgi:hypothetical protein